MNIAFVHQPIDPMIPPHQNSIALWTYHLAPHLILNNKVEVYGKRNRLQKNLYDPHGVLYHFVQSIPDRITQKISRLYLKRTSISKPFISSIWFGLDYILLVSLFLRIRKTDIIHVQNFTQFVPILRALCPKAKIVLHMHGEWLSALDYETMKQRAAKADLILGVSDHITGLIQRRYPELSGRCATIYNGVSTDLFCPDGKADTSKPSRAKRILFVGRVSPEKGVHTLIEAFTIVAKDFPDAHLDITGLVGAMPISHIIQVSDDPIVKALARFYPQDYGAALNQLIPAHLTRQVHFTGPVPQTDLIAYYRAADVLVNPSLSESFGMSLVEAMATETPVIATRVGGMTEIVEEGCCGLMVEPDDPQALANAMLVLLRDDDLRARMGKQGRQRVLERFGWPTIASCLQMQYNRIQ